MRQNTAVNATKHRGESIHSPRCFHPFTAVFFSCVLKEALGIVHGSANIAQCPGLQFDDHAAFLRGIEGKRDAVGGCLSVAETGIIVWMTEQYGRAVAQGCRYFVRFLEQPAANSLILIVRGHGKWSYGQGDSRGFFRRISTVVSRM